VCRQIEFKQTQVDWAARKLQLDEIAEKAKSLAEEKQFLLNKLSVMSPTQQNAQALEDTLVYLRERHAFGEPLGQKQALRHKVADMATEIEAARQLVYHAVACYLAGEDSTTQVSMAKLFATEVANRVAYGAVQLHGGYGYMREFPVEGFFRDVRLWTIASGTSEIMKEIIAKKLLP